ncbi:MAG: neutral/alkaline non-lysosomal ceramidase N-terminal domain-containing protein [Bryobacterales bacterium]|nr:neutral/alkaline non-lysosomal ceramidase N-terminal domain-containing protein [Bryobacterales bacterium]
MLRFALMLAVVTAAARADVVEQGPKDSAPSGLLAGVARADISPPSGIPHMNWGSQTHVGAVAHDPAGMIATVLVVSDGKQKLALVDVDALFVDRLASVPERAEALTGIPAAHIRLGATHTHAGPFLTTDKGPVGIDLEGYRAGFANYWAVVADKIVGAIAEANARMEPAHLGVSKGTGSININRRVRRTPSSPPAVGLNPDGLVDRDLVVARIDNARGEPLAVIVNFQCHGTVLAWENKHLSPDWPGMMRRTVEAALPGAKCLFFQGAAGNQGPIEGLTGDVAVAHRLGRILGHEAAALALHTETVKRAPKLEGFVESTAYLARQPWRVSGPRDATVRVVSTVIEVPGRVYTERDVMRMQTLVSDAEGGVRRAASSPDLWVKHAAGARLRRFQDLLNKWKQPASRPPIAVRIQAMRIGELAIVSMPGEPFAEIGIAVKRASPLAGTTMFCGYSSGEGGEYMPVEEEYEMEGYEVDRTPYGTLAAKQVIAAASALAQRLK